MITYSVKLFEINKIYMFQNVICHPNAVLTFAMVIHIIVAIEIPAGKLNLNINPQQYQTIQVYIKFYYILNFTNFFSK